MCIALLTKGEEDSTLMDVDQDVIRMPELRHLHIAKEFDDKHVPEQPSRLMRVCDNFVTRDIRSKFGRSGVRKAVQKYIEWMSDHPVSSVVPFTGAWRGELHRVIGPKMKRCKHFHTFGTKYDEQKMFCLLTEESASSGTKGNGTTTTTAADGVECSVYSIGSNNIWDFEEAMFKATPCSIHAFDCTVGHKAAPPRSIRGRTTLHRTCLARTAPRNNELIYQVRPQDIGFDMTIVTSGDTAPLLNFTTVPGLNHLAKTPLGAAYFKLDIEGYEWGILRSMVRWASEPGSGAARDRGLPKQIFGEFHLDRDVSITNKYSILSADRAHVGQRLRHFIDEMFVRGGYMVMFERETVQSRNADALFVKVMCAMDDI